MRIEIIAIKSGKRSKLLVCSTYVPIWTTMNEDNGWQRSSRSWRFVDRRLEYRAVRSSAVEPFSSGYIKGSYQSRVVRELCCTAGFSDAVYFWRPTSGALGYGIHSVNVVMIVRFD